MTDFTDSALAALRRVGKVLGATEDRPGQVDMLNRVAAALEAGGGSQLQVTAPVGTGKSMALLIPAILAKRAGLADGPVVIATGTKALQDQYVGDLKLLKEHLGVPFRWALLKGTSNYACLQARAEFDESGVLPGFDRAPDARSLAVVDEWLETTKTGDFGELPFLLDGATKAACSVGQGECPGAKKCPSGDRCWASAARTRSQGVDILVVNTALLLMDVALGGILLPEHSVLMVDEAHRLPEIARESLGVVVTPGRIEQAGKRLAGLLYESPLPERFASVAQILDSAIAERLTRAKRSPDLIRLRGGAGAHDDIGGPLRSAIELVERAVAELAKVPESPQRDRLVKSLVESLLPDLRQAASNADGAVAWVERDGRRTTVRTAQVDPARVLAEYWASHETTVFASGTLPSTYAEEIGLDWADVAEVASPFDWTTQACLVVPKLPDPSKEREDWQAEAPEAVVRAVRAAGGRALILTSSFRDMETLAERLRVEFPAITVMDQRDGSKAELLRRLNEDETSVLCASQGFYEGVDIKNPRALRLVVLYRMPFLTPDDVINQARKELVPGTFWDQMKAVDIPRAGMLTAQALGRGVRSSRHRCALLVTDPRLATATYRRDILRMLPAALVPRGNRPHREMAVLEDFLADVFSGEMDSDPAEPSQVREPIPVEDPVSAEVEIVESVAVADEDDDRQRWILNAPDAHRAPVDAYDDVAPRPVAPRSPHARQPITAGLYAVEVAGALRFCRIEIGGPGRWEGYEFVSIIDGDTERKARGLNEAKPYLDAIRSDPAEAMAAYGREIGKCGRCGRQLTTEASRSLGIGPECAAKMAA